MSNNYQTFSFPLEYFFRAAYTGSVDKLREMEKWPVNSPENSMKELARRINYDEETALGLACQFGHLEMVRYLVENCDADVNQISKIGQSNDGSDDLLGTPLQAAVKSAYLDIVRYLVEDCQADVNVPIKTRFIPSTSPHDGGNTPLHTAVFHLSGEIQEDIITCLVKNGANMSAYNDVKSPCWALTSDANVIKLLIHLGLDINETIDKGLESLIHVWARSIDEASMEVLELLVDKGADLDRKNYDGLTPLWISALGVDGHPNEDAFNLIFARQEPKLSRLDKILAFELIGATYLTASDQEAFHSGLLYWRKAMELRFNSEYPPMPKLAIQLTERGRLAFGRCEFETLQELEDLVIFNPNALKVQALLTYFRILGPSIYELWTSLTNYALECWSYNESQRFINLSMFLIECVKSSFSTNFYEPADTARQLIMAFYTLRQDPDDAHIVTFETVMSVLDCSVNELIKSETVGLEDADSDEVEIRDIHLDCVIQSAILLTSMSLTEDQSHQFKRSIFQVIQLNLTHSNRAGRDLLLLACDSSSFSFSPEGVSDEPFEEDVEVGQLPSESVIKLLLELGSNPESIDLHGDTGLHILARNGQSHESSTVKALFEGGAHLDACNIDGQTMDDILHGDVIRQPNTILSNPLEFPRLKCLAARALLNGSGLIFNDLSHTELFAFVMKH